MCSNKVEYGTFFFRYLIYPKYLDTLTPYHCPNTGTSPVLLFLVSRVTNIVSSDKMPYSGACDLGLSSLFGLVCPNMKGKYSISICIVFVIILDILW